MRIFRKPCVSEAQVLDAVKSGKFKLEEEDAYLRQVQEEDPEEYEYVRREFGYDYVPPSQYVPSHSMASSSIEVFERPVRIETPVRIEVPGSDISESLAEQDIYVMDFDPFADKNYHHQSARTMPMPSSRSSTPKAYNRQPPKPPYQGGSPATPKPYHRASPVEKQMRTGRETPPPKSYHRAPSPQQVPAPPPQRAYRREPSDHRRSPSPQVLEHPPQRAYRREPSDHRRSPSPQVPVHPPQRAHNREPLEKPYRAGKSERTYQQRKAYEESSQFDDDDLGIKRVPTAFSYLSDDSGENFWEEKSRVSRYSTHEEKSRSSRSGSSGPKNHSGWGVSDTSFNERHGKKKSSDLEDFTTPAYRRKDPHEARDDEYEDAEGREEHRDGRSRRRSQSRDKRELRGRGRSHEISSHHRPDRSNSLEREGFGIEGIRRHAAYDAVHLASHMEHKHGERKKSRGIFGRIRDSVRGSDRPARGVLSSRASQFAPQNQHPDDEGWEERSRSKSLFKPATSNQSNVSYEIPEESRIAYRYEDDYQRHIPGSSPPMPPGYEQARSRSGRASPYSRRAAAIDDAGWADTGTHMPRNRSSSSAVPFESFRGPTPTLRNNSGHRHRQIPMAHSMSKHYNRPPPPPAKAGKGMAGLNQQGQQVRYHEASDSFKVQAGNKGFVSCY